MTTRFLRPTAALVATAAVAAALAACGSDAKSASGSASAGNAKVANVLITSDKCVADRDSYDAGTVTINVENKDATGITEFELMKGDLIVAEKENLPPGFKGTVTTNLQPGDYEMYCPGATTPKVALKVTGTAPASATGDTHDLLVQGTKDYAKYVSDQTAQLTAATEAFVAAVKSGDLAKAKAEYIKARPAYEKIEPVAEKFADLDAAIDARPDDGQGPESVTGFHNLEYAIFDKGSLEGTGPTADELLANVKKLEETSKTLEYQPADLANGAVGLLEEVSSSKLKDGEEEAYSHIDLVDAQANVEGSQQLFAALTPGLNKIDPELVKTISGSFDALDAKLDAVRDTSQPSGFKLYPDLTAEELKGLQAAVLTVHDQLSTVAAKVVNA